MTAAKSQPLEEADDSPLDQFIGYNLKRAYVIVQADFRQALGEDGLAPRVFSALNLVVQYPNMTQSALAKLLGIERSGLVAIIDELEGRGYLERTRVPGDRRVHALAATTEGQAANKALQTSVKDHENRLLSHMSADEKETLITLLKKIRKKEHP